MTKALVTGATRAPGRLIATTLAKGGWEVHALGRDRVVLEEKRGDHGIAPMAMDLTDRDYVRFVVEGMEPEAVIRAASVAQGNRISEPHGGGHRYGA